jgi:hypothetical protein
MITDNPQNRWSDPELSGVRMNTRDTFSGTELANIQKTESLRLQCSNHHITHIATVSEQYITVGLKELKPA